MTVLQFPSAPGGAGDADARRQIREDLDATLVVEAAAGTGKTTELVNRILRVLATGRASITGIVAVTFTEKAAGELKLRLRERLEQERSAPVDDTVRARLEEALEKLEEAHVNTIHGFCAELLRERPVEARVDPLFVVLTEPQAAALYDRAFSRWLEETLQDPPEGVRRALRRTSAPMFGGGDADGPVDRLRNAGRALAEARDFQHPWRRPPFERRQRLLDSLEELHQLADLCASPVSGRDNLYADLDGVRRLSGQVRLERSFGVEDLDGWEARLVDLVRERGFSRTRKGSGYRYGKLRSSGGGERDVTRTEVVAARDALFARLQEFRRDADADLAAALQQELAEATSRYQAAKAAAGALDFTDLLARARDVIRDDETVRGHLQSKFSHIFVDEFQDTDPIQAEILLLLAAGDASVSAAFESHPKPGKLFIVGDPKQAIYRFRGTDVATYWRVGEHLAARGGRVVQLSTSFRSVPEIQTFVNSAFSRAMQESPLALQARYVPLAGSRPSDRSQPAVVALPVPAPYSNRGGLDVSAWAIEASTPDAVAAFVAWIVDEKNGWTVAVPDGDGEKRVPIQPSHVALLFRRFVSFGKDVTRDYTDALEARGVPHLLVGGKSFHGREEVEMMRAALAAIEWPDDELSVFATLKGALFAFDDELLLEYGHRFGRAGARAAFHPFRIPAELGGNYGKDLALSAEPTAHLVPIAEALRLLQRLHRRRNFRPVADTVAALLSETRAHVGLILRPGGEQVLANVLHVAELARQYEANGGISFRGFIDQLKAAAEAEGGAEAPILEESSDGVRIMTVHKAKGLEFPVVVLADPTCRLSRQDASRYLDLPRGLCAMKIGGWAPHELHEHEAEEVLRDEAEGVRLAYVAATRARDLLVVPAVGDGPWEGGWFSPLNDALYPPIERRRAPGRGPKCPAFRSKDTVLRRPNEEPASHQTVAPGLHELAGYSVVWWDPGALDLERRATVGVRREDLIVKDVPRDVVADGQANYDGWRRARAAARSSGSVPSLALATVRAWVDDPARVDPPEIDPSAVSIVDLSPERPPADWQSGGAAFGMIVHGILARGAFAATRDELVDLATMECRLLDADETIASAAAEMAARVFAHPLMARARAADAEGACRRETPVTCTLADGTLLEGVVDLAFFADGQWHVVDFKTDRQMDAATEWSYRRQVALYAFAIRQATGQPAAATIVRA